MITRDDEMLDRRKGTTKEKRKRERERGLNVLTFLLYLKNICIYAYICTLYKHKKLDLYKFYFFSRDSKQYN